MLRKFENWDIEPSDKEKSDIVGLPSGEIIMINTLFTLNQLINDNLIVKIDEWGDRVINKWCFDDRNRERILDVMDDNE